MWTEYKPAISGRADIEIVNRGFVVAEALVSPGRSFAGSDNPLGTGVNIPTLFIWKVHKGHPMNVTNSESYTSFWPNSFPRSMTPSEMYNNSKLYDLSTFMLIPFQLNAGKVTQSIPLEESFKASSGERQQATLFYIPHGASVGNQDVIRRVSAGVMPSHVLGHLRMFVGEPHRVYSYPNAEELGEIDVPIDVRRKVIPSLKDLLVSRYAGIERG